MGGAALIERTPDNPARVGRHIRMIADAARRGAAITSRLLSFSRRGVLRAEPVDAAELLAGLSEVLTHTLGGAVRCETHAPEGLPSLLADRGQLETVLVNLATNARDAMPNGGTLLLSAGVETVMDSGGHPANLLPGRYVFISARDTGEGMDAATLERVTEPFFTTKAPGAGTGLGLAMAKGFVEQSGGGFLIDSILGQGTTVTLWLPQAADSHPAEKEYGMTPASATSTQAVLVVDDDEFVREVMAASLEDAGYAVVEADSGAQALTVLRSDTRVDVLLSDLTMPGMDGLQLIRAAQEIRPGLPAILLTGYTGAGASMAVGAAVEGTFALLRKPVSGGQLTERIAAILAVGTASENAAS
jgi:CheY-like chemotaxis protein